MKRGQDFHDDRSKIFMVTIIVNGQDFHDDRLTFYYEWLRFHDDRSRFLFLFLVLLKETRTQDEVKISSSFFGVNQEN